MKRSWPFLVSILIIAAAAVAGCREGQPPSHGQKGKITVGYSRLRISLPVFVAKEQGLFEKHGLNVTLLMYDTAQPLMQALVEGRIDLGGFTALPITYNGMLRTGTELLFLTTLIEDQDHRISYLLRRVPAPGEEPTIKAITDLKGMSIGILPTIAYKAWIGEILRQEGLDPDRDVRIRPIAPALQALNLQSGGVQALFTNDPAATSTIEAGIGELVLPTTVEVPYYIESPFAFGSFNVRKDWALANTETYLRLVRALNEAVIFVNENPQKAKQAMKPYLPDDFKKHVDKYPDARYLPTNESSPTQFQEMADRYLKMGIIPAALDVSSLIETNEH